MVWSDECLMTPDSGGHVIDTSTLWKSKRRSSAAAYTALNARRAGQ
jgi:hypothetical protein